ncbi:unnamed protein product [Brassica oleracea var. botrytis]
MSGNSVGGPHRSRPIYLIMRPSQVEDAMIHYGIVRPLLLVEECLTLMIERSAV